MEKVFDSVERIYQTSGNVVPEGWNKSHNMGYPFPDYLKDASAWMGSTQDIINSINSGCNLVLHRDHGGVEGWGTPSFKTSDLARLNNTIYPIVLSINCQTGRYMTPNNFSKTLLCKPSAGAVAVIGATVDSYTYYNDIIALGMLKSIWPALNIKSYSNYSQFNTNIDDTANTIGEAFAVGITKMEESDPNSKAYTLHQRREYHCLGDPSLHIFWNANQSFRNSISATYEDELATISLGGKFHGYISIWDAAQGKLQRYYGNYVEYETPASETMVTITCAGYRPVTFMLMQCPKSTTGLGDARLKTSTFNGDSELNIEVEAERTDNLSLTIAEADNVMAASCTTLDVSDNVTTYQIKDRNKRFFFVTLRKGNEIVDSKTLYKSY